jgi:hypothetical protein
MLSRCQSRGKPLYKAPLSEQGHRITPRTLSQRSWQPAELLPNL